LLFLDGSGDDDFPVVYLQTVVFVRVIKLQALAYANLGRSLVKIVNYQSGSK
jgi:hypothetical protein